MELISSPTLGFDSQLTWPHQASSMITDMNECLAHQRYEASFSETCAPLREAPAKCITDLDDLCLLTIFSHVKNIREKIRLKRVCRRFEYIASLSLKIHHKWIRKRFEVYYDREMRLYARNERRVQFPFDKILRNCSNLCEFNSTAFDRIRWNPSKMPKVLDLERLTLMGWCNVKISKTIIERCPNLKSLDIGCLKVSKKYSDYRIDLAGITSSLLCLRLRGIHYTSENIRCFMRSRGYSLETFYYSSYVTSVSTVCEPNFFTSLVQILYESCIMLKEVELRLVQQNAFGPLDLLSPLYNLERMVIITEQRNLTVEMLETIVGNSPSLKYVIIVSNHVKEADLYGLCRKYCPAIKEYKCFPFSWDFVIQGNPGKI